MIDKAKRLIKMRSSTTSAEALREMYIDLLAGAVTHTIYHPVDFRRPPPEVMEAWQDALRSEGAKIPLPSEYEQRLEGRDRPLFGQTMIGRLRIDNLRRCTESIIADGIPGDLIEAGCWRGGAGILMKGILAAYGETERSVLLADSFRGLPEPDVERYPADAGDINHLEDALAIPLEEVRANFERYGLLDERVELLEGWFRDTLPGLRGREWSLVRLDGDLYESTMDGLENLYPDLAPGGYLIVDDYGMENCRQAVEDYRRKHAIDTPVERVDWVGAYWRKAG